MGLFNRTKIDKKTIIPVWFMRQAGRYHSHYQNIKKEHNFLEMCTNAKLACEVTMGPINQFDFDAAILFSDLLFPLDHLGMNIQYLPGPKTDFLINSKEDLKKLKINKSAETYYDFQRDACKQIRAELDHEKSLLGFVGGPFTLYAYATEGTHSSNLTNAKCGLRNGLYQSFLDHLLPSLWAEMKLQALGGIDTICIFDTAAGTLTQKDFIDFILPSLKETTSQFKKEFPNIKIVYYSKHININYLQEIQDDNIDILGIDWRLDLTNVLNKLGNDYMIQGNLDPSFLCLAWNDLKIELDYMWNKVIRSEISPNQYIYGLGHGVLPSVPQENVKKAIQHIHENYRY